MTKPELPITTQLLPKQLPSFQRGSVPSRLLVAAVNVAPVVFVAALALISSLIYVQSPNGLTPIYDDSFISLTFARNVAEHAMLSFDGDTWSTGATSPGHVLVLAAMIKLGFSPVWSGIAVGVVSHVLLAAAVYLLTWAVFRSRLAAVIAGAAIAFANYAAMDAGNGLETSMFMTLVTLAMATYFLLPDLKGRALTGLIIGAAALTRPEGAFLLPAVLIYRWLDRSDDDTWRKLATEAVLLATPGVIAAGGIALYSLIVGDSVAGTATAKMHFFQESYWRLIDKITFAQDRTASFAAPLLTLVIAGAVVANRKPVLMFALFLTPMYVLQTLYFPGGMEHYFFRYQHPAMPFIAVLAGGGAAYLIGKAATANFVAKALMVAALVIAIVPLYQQYERWRLIYRDASNETRSLLIEMVQDLNTIVEPNEVVASHDIGALGYYGDFQVMDLVGLVNPKVVDFHKDRRVKAYVEGAMPDYLLVFPEWDYEFLHIFPGDDPARYELVKVYPGGTVRVLPYVLYRVHNDVAVGQDGP